MPRTVSSATMPVSLHSIRQTRPSGPRSLPSLNGRRRNRIASSPPQVKRTNTPQIRRSER
ncbi:MAG: hypothetical protein MI923_18895 [Phycisphaerales bacterium]|nr:hypothetical protein [Phycisphaerales bacterium]